MNIKIDEKVLLALEVRLVGSGVYRCAVCARSGEIYSSENYLDGVAMAVFKEDFEEETAHPDERSLVCPSCTCRRGL